MTASEFAFLALGLVLGVACGAALLEVIRARPAAPREVRLTVTPDSVPRRLSATLAAPAFAAGLAAPAPGGPADPALFAAHGNEPGEPSPVLEAQGTTDWSSAGVPRTSVLSTSHAGARPSRVTPTPPAPQAPKAPTTPAPRSPMVGIPITPEHDTFLASLLKWGGSGASTAVLAPPSPTRIPSSGHRTRPAPDTRALRRAGQEHLRQPRRDQHDHRPSEPRGQHDPDAPSGTTGSAATDLTEASRSGTYDGPCADQRRFADERCQLAVRARDQATAAQARLRETQRAYDDHVSRVERAAAAADPRAIHAAKDVAQIAFRNARRMAASRQDVEAAARDWLTEVNRINQDSRNAVALAAREREAATALVTVIERLAVEADGKRISAEAADETCLAARQALAACEETAAAQPVESGLLPATADEHPIGVTAAPEAPLGGGSGLAKLAAATVEPRSERPTAPALTRAQSRPDTAPALAEPSERIGEPAILRLLRGDHAVLEGIVSRLSSDPIEQRQWQVRLGELADAIVARAIEESALDFPIDHPFWGLFSQQEDREIAAAMASLGFHFDGLGGFLDDRVPSTRDLSLAIGYAGLDPMRIRRWPNETEMLDLLRDVTVAADEYLAGAASDLTLGEMVSVLGRRADELADLWNAWGRIRPLLLAAA